MFAFMRKFFERLDGLAGIDGEPASIVWLERFAFVFLVFTFAAAPHSIAATQTAWIVGMLAWIVRLFFRPRVRFRLGWLDIALWGFFLWSIISSLVSYEPLVSIDKLRGAAVFLIFYFVLYNIRTRRAAVFLAGVMIVSCMANVLWMPIERLIGRGVEIEGVALNSPLAKPGLIDGDTLLEVDRRKVSTPESVIAALEQNEVSKVKFYRPDFELTIDVKRADLLPGGNALEKLGITGWKKSHNWRSKGFYGHYTTYAEVLQLIGSLVFGLLIAALPSGRVEKRMRRGEDATKVAPVSIILLGCSLVAIGFALLLTVTRAPQLSFVISAGLIVLVGLGRRWFLTAVLVLIPVALVGLIFLQQSRKVDFFDSKDESTRYRQMMVRDGLRLWTTSPRHFVFGVGMDSLQKHWQEWGMFDRGWQPMGHFHSTPVQLLAERGLPGLLIWLAVLGIYARALWRGLKVRPAGDWHSRGILLGCLGGLAGFVTSGLAHYNLGDQEVAMVFFMLMGLGLYLSAPKGRGPDDREASQGVIRLAA
jgi:hypothetical protein